jgi:catechol 2,3-dioxygenase-like lactoylglutathione lyase family enzyme
MVAGNATTATTTPNNTSLRTPPVYDRAVIKAVHTLLYSDDPAATRAFLRDVLGLPYVEHPESEPGWLIFKTGPSELGVHPTTYSYEGQDFAHPRHHSVSLICDDVEATRAELEARGAEFSSEIEDLGFGLGTTLELPGAGGILLYEPRHPEAFSL